MADDIIQKLGFDLGDTLSKLASLEAGFSRFNAALNNAATGVRAFNAASGNVVKPLNDATKATKSWVLSWETLSRVMQTQALIRGYNMIRDSIEFAYASQIQFSKSVSEVKTIDPGRSYSEIASNLRELSDALNQPLSNVVEAQYQAISDQFAEAADHANILAAANLLAKTTEDDLVGATQLLTGALNAYGESSEMAGLRAAQFFESINLGRFRANELGTALGRVQSLGYELGVSMEELQAALISITIGGVKASEGATQLRGILTALLKPSDAMKEAFAQLGIESGEAAIRTWGLQGALEAVKSATDGSSTALGKLFPNVRGAAGGFRLLAEGATKYKEAEDSLRKIDQSVLSGKATEALGTDAARLTAELNKLRNFFTVELGSEMVGRMNLLINFLGGGNGLVGVLRLVTSETPKAAAAVGALYLAMSKFGAAADVQWARFGTGIDGGVKKLATLRNALGLLATYEVGRILGQQIGGMVDQMLTAPYEKQRAALQQSIDTNKQRTEAAVREKDRENAALSKRLRQHLTEANKTYLEDAANFQDAMKVQERSVQRAFDKIVQMRQKMTQDLFATADAAAKKASDIPQVVADIEQRISDRQFETGLAGKSLNQQLDAYVDKARQALNLANDLQATAKSDEQEKQAASAWSRADAFAQQAQAIAQQTGDVRKLQEAAWLLDSLDNSRIDALEKQAKVQDKLSKEAEERAWQAEAHNDELMRGRDAIEQKLNAWTKDDQGASILKNPEQARKDLDEVDGLIRDWTGKVQRYTQGDFLKSFMGDAQAFETLKREAERSLASLYVKEIRYAPEAVAAMWDDLQASATSLRLEFPAIVKIESLTGKNLIQDGLNEVLTAFERQVSETTGRSVRAASAIRDEEAARRQYEQARAAVGNTPLTGETEPSPGYLMDAGARADLLAFTQLMDRLSQSASITSEEMQKLKELSGAVDVRKAFPELGRAGSVQFRESLISMMDSIGKMREAQVRAQANSADQNTSGELDAINQQINAIQGKHGAQSKAAEQAEFEKTITIEGATAANALETAWWGVAEAITAAASAAKFSGDFGSQYAALGGSIRYFDRGGSVARGTDVVPAMLSAGEFVMSQRAAQRWHSQLVAMNAGIKPVFRSEGGSVTNVGDINVTVSGGGSSHQTARSIAVALRRELRRGITTL